MKKTLKQTNPPPKPRKITKQVKERNQSDKGDWAPELKMSEGFPGQ